MKEITERVQDVLNSEFKGHGFAGVDLVPIPPQKDRWSRLRTLEELLQQFDNDTLEAGIQNYIVSLRPQSQKADPVASGPESAIDGIYDQHGKLNVDYLNRNARILIQAGEVHLARNIYQSMLKSHECEWLARLGLAHCALKEGKKAEAIKCYEESITYRPSKEAYAELIGILLEAGEDRKAVEGLERALYLRDLDHATRAQFHCQAGVIWMKLNQIDVAEAHFKQAIQLNPSLDEVRSNLGSVYLARGEIEKAARCFQDAIASNSSNAKAFLGLGQCFELRAIHDQAHDCFAKAAILQPHDPTTLFYLVKSAYESKNYLTAERVLSGYIESNPVNLSLLYSLAGLKFHLGKSEETKRILKGILDLKPDHRGAQDFLKRL